MLKRILPVTVDNLKCRSVDEEIAPKTLPYLDNAVTAAMLFWMVICPLWVVTSASESMERRVQLPSANETFKWENEPVIVQSVLVPNSCTNLLLGNFILKGTSKN